MTYQSNTAVASHQPLFDLLNYMIHLCHHVLLCIPGRTVYEQVLKPSPSRPSPPSQRCPDDSVEFSRKLDRTHLFPFFFKFYLNSPKSKNKNIQISCCKFCRTRRFLTPKYESLFPQQEVIRWSRLPVWVSRHQSAGQMFSRLCSSFSGPKERVRHLSDPWPSDPSYWFCLSCSGPSVR